MFKTYTPSGDSIERNWWVVDADGKTLGRLATEIASVLRGKHKPTYTPNLDTGDFVVVVNAEKVLVTGDRLDSKIYYRHSKYQGGLKEISLRKQLLKFPTRPIEDAVKGMLPKTALGRNQLKKLKVYAGPAHPHEAQKPQALEIKGE
ncbi:MAG: 50S ribosomal protein L13 [Pleurocapsa minor GSE-CHR-MK-17-07R]|jgi:large subunit ribosomal protein L13|nr:50S ribosomal protein L13 [Pleurocapsa minor GSE-CHR-MK 17-07R]